MSVLLFGRSEKYGFDDAGLKRLHHFMIKFSTRYVSPRTNLEVMPSTKLKYVRGVQRRLIELGMKVNLFSGPVFDDPEEALTCVLDNKFAQQQFRGRLMKSRNILTVDGIRTIFNKFYILAPE